MTAETKFSPQPLRKNRVAGGIDLVGHGGTTIATVWIDTVVPEEEAQEYANRFVAAPEMYEALAYWLDYVQHSSLDNVAPLRGWQGKAMDALKKARGES